MLVCVCGGVGAGLDRVQRLQGHNAGLIRRGGPQVLPLPVPQHLPGGSPCPPVATFGRLIRPWMRRIVSQDTQLHLHTHCYLYQ